MAKKTKSPKTDIGPVRELKSIPVKTFIDDYIYRIDLDADYQRERFGLETTNWIWLTQSSRT